MKTLFSLFAALLVVSAVRAHDDTNIRTHYTADVSSSEIIWKGYKVTGKHHGTVELENGSLFFENNTLVGGEFTIDMTTIKNLDMAGSGGAAKLEGHLKSDDFFGVTAYPTAKFVITKVIPYGTEGDYKVSGDMTIKNITKPVKFMAKVTNEGGVIEATADITVDRSDFDVRYGSGSFFDDLGDKAISDDFDLNIKLALNPA